MTQYQKHKVAVGSVRQLRPYLHSFICCHIHMFWCTFLLNFPCSVIGRIQSENITENRFLAFLCAFKMINSLNCKFNNSTFWGTPLTPHTFKTSLGNGHFIFEVTGSYFHYNLTNAQVSKYSCACKYVRIYSKLRVCPILFHVASLLPMSMGQWPLRRGGRPIRERSVATQGKRHW